jgi:hypothetical protein
MVRFLSRLRITRARSRRQARFGGLAFAHNVYYTWFGCWSEDRLTAATSGGKHDAGCQHFRVLDVHRHNGQRVSDCGRVQKYEGPYRMHMRGPERWCSQNATRWRRALGLKAKWSRSDQRSVRAVQCQGSRAPVASVMTRPVRRCSGVSGSWVDRTEAPI